MIQKLICNILVFWAIVTCSYAVCAAEPGFAVRAAYVDCRTEVRTMEALKEFASDAADNGMNAILMEWEATFPFRENAVLCNQYAFSRDEVIDFVKYCDGLGLDVIPLQNCFGHSEYILRHPRYHSIRESRKDPSQVCPLKVEEAAEIFRSIFAEVAELHPSKYFHIGADETYLLGQCKDCQRFAGEFGKSKLFVDYVKKMCEIVIGMGKTPVIWADIILDHPEAIHELPRQVIFVDWNYGWPIRHAELIESLVKEGAEFWGATALRSGPDNIYCTDWKKHFYNLDTFVGFARKTGYTSMVQTSWSTSGTYGYHYDYGFEVINMQPVRLVYPDSGFKILQAASGEAYLSGGAFDPEAFVFRYAKEHFGLSDGDAGTLWDYFCMPQNVINVRRGVDSSGKDLHQLVTESETMLRRIETLRPKSHKDEIAHLVLMLEIRLNYLKFKEVEFQYEGRGYSSALAPSLADRLAGICSEGRKIDRKFEKLNKGYLKAGEIEYFCKMRGERMETLLKILENNK